MKYLILLALAVFCATIFAGYSPTAAIDCGGGGDDDDDTGDDDTVTDPDALKVITFNLRYANLGDFPNHWSGRKDLVFDYLNDQSPDVFGVQEGLLK